MGLYRISPGKGSNKTMIVLYCVTIIDPATCWFEFKETTTKSFNVVSNIVEQMWLTRYLCPQKVILDRGMEFMKDFIAVIYNEYRIKCKPITTRNLQANIIVERAHQTIGNLLCTFKIGITELDLEDPWGCILSREMFSLQSTIHATQKATPMQLVFRRDAMLNITYLANWQYI
eukprot:15365347-Ditylum_brightwellii.AAC.2